MIDISKAIWDEYNRSYPEGSLDETIGKEALAQIEGMAKTVKLYAEKVSQETKPKSEIDEKFDHNIYSEFQPTCITETKEDALKFEQKIKDRNKKAKLNELNFAFATRILNDIKWYKEKRDKIDEENKKAQYRKSSYLDLHLALQTIKSRLQILEDFIFVSDQYE